MLVISIVLEAAVAVLAILAARRDKPYAYGFALTFAIYVLYDAARLGGLNVHTGFFSILFLIASLSALTGAWGLYRR